MAEHQPYGDVTLRVSISDAVRFVHLPGDLEAAISLLQHRPLPQPASFSGLIYLAPKPLLVGFVTPPCPVRRTDGNLVSIVNGLEQIKMMLLSDCEMLGLLHEFKHSIGRRL